MNELIINEPKFVEVSKKEQILKDDVPEYLDRTEIHQIFYAIPKEKHRELMLLAFLWNTGVRISEAITIKKGNIDFNTKNLKILWLKRRKLMTRALPINDKFAYSLATYTGGMNKDDLLFPFTRQRADQICKKYNFVLNKELHCHLFRHSFAVNYLKQTNDIVGLKTLLGHQNITNTLIYAKIVNADIREKLNSIEF